MHRSLLLPKSWLSQSSLSGENWQPFDCSRTFLFLKALIFLKGKWWIQAWRSQYGETPDSPLSHLQKSYSWEPDAKADPAYSEWQQFTLPALLVIPIPLFPLHWTPPSFTLLDFFVLLASTFDVFCFLLPRMRFSSINPETMLILNTIPFALFLSVLEFAVGKETSLEMRLLHIFSLFPCCLLSCAIPPVELNPHLQFQPFLLLLLTHSSNLFSCIHFFLYNRMQIFIPRESQKKNNNHFTFPLPTPFPFPSLQLSLLPHTTDMKHICQNSHSHHPIPHSSFAVFLLHFSFYSRSDTAAGQPTSISSVWKPTSDPFLL